MTRFFVNSENIHAKAITLSPPDTEHIRSLRLRPDEQFIVCDGNGIDYICKLGENKPDGESIANIIKKQKSQAEPTVNCTAYIAYAKGDRLDIAVQKTVEIGINKIVLFESARCIAKPNNVQQKTERFQKIAEEAAKQSGRGRIPTVTAVRDFRSAADAACLEDLSLLCYEEEENLHINTVLRHFFPSDAFLRASRGKVKTVAIMTGPEGGFEPSEIEYAQSKNISVASLGPRIFRSETAPIVALSAIMYHTGNL